MSDKRSLAKAHIVPLNQVIQDRLKAFIKENSLRPGDKLPTEAELATEIGVSRTAVREALRGLETLGIIDVQKGSGRYLKKVVFSEIIDDLAYNLELSSANLVDLLEIRAVLETQFITKAIDTLTEQDLANLEHILGKMKAEMLRGKSFAQEDMEFHHCIFGRVNNQLLQELLRTFWKLFTEALPEELKLPDHNEIVLQHHTDLLGFISQKNGKMAKHLLQDHFTDVIERLKVN